MNFFQNILHSLGKFPKHLKEFTHIPKNLSSAFISPMCVFAVIAVLLIIFAIIKVRKIKFTTKLTAQIGISLAICVVLNMLKVYELPQGGSVTMGEMVPILLLSLVYGPEVGMLTGFLYGIISLILGPYVVHPLQLLFDYPLAFMCLGLTGYFKNSKLNNLDKKNRNFIDFLAYPVLPIFVGIFGRFICHLISGVIFFASEAPKGESPFLYSAIYNGSFLFVDFIICAVIFAIIPLKRMSAAIKG